MDPVELSKKLISYKSITPESKGSLEFIKSILEKKDFNCDLLEFGGEKIKNLYAFYNGGRGPTICFAGHVDVVPPGNIVDWKTNPFKAQIINKRLYGRGASDMKTSIASFLSATFDFIKKNKKFNGSLCFLLTADEEGDADFGTKMVVNWLKKKRKKIDFCIVGEPTNPEKLGDMVKIGRRGSINGVIEVIGKQGHVAYPELSINPINFLIKICNELQRPFDKGSKRFEPTKVSITSVDVGNQVTNLVPSRAYIKFNVRFNDKFTSKKIIEEIKKRIEKTRIKYNLKTKVSGESFLNYSEKFTEILIKCIRNRTKRNTKLSTSGGTSDARFISKLCPVIEFGIVGKTMHQANENVLTSEIIVLKDIYYEFIEKVFQ